MDRNNVSLQARKQRRYAKLNAEIQQLTQNLTTLQGNLKTATDQLPALRNMASLHGSILYASNQVLNEHNETLRSK